MSILESITDNLVINTRNVSLWPTLMTIALALGLYIVLQRRWEYQADQAFGRSHGCLPMETKLPYKWPLALDILKRQYDALPSQRLLAFQSQYLEKMPNMELHLFGQVGYMTTDPRNIESILSTRFEDWGLGSRRGGLFPLLGEGIFTQDGRPWKHSREILRRQFVRLNFKDLSTFDQHVDDLIAELSSSEGVVDLQPLFFRFTLATTTALIFGEPISGLGNEDHDTFANCFDYASMISAIRLRLADFHWAYTPKAFTKACDTVKRYASHFVDEALKNRERSHSQSKSQSQDLIRDLYEALKSPDLVRDQLVHVLIAGRDTTACLMSWTFFLLVRHPNVLYRLRQEVNSIWPEGDQLTRAHLQQMPYLKCILNETLRLYPQLPVNIRVALKTTLLPVGGGPDGQSPVLIRRGTGVGYSVYHMHRHKDLYGDDANEFRPERWEGSELDRIGWGFMPFHGGPRICLGSEFFLSMVSLVVLLAANLVYITEEFALMEASCGIVRIIQKFPKLKLPPEIPQEPTGLEKQSLTIVVSSAEGCKVLLC
ncbi:MAG: hypothetical protein M1835_005787 [Candelina submexicana]|nr:MAG: hypothetical protein M1835_005787 [Candelina submexicana]